MTTPHWQSQAPEFVAAVRRAQWGVDRRDFAARITRVCSVPGGLDWFCGRAAARRSAQCSATERNPARARSAQRPLGSYRRARTCGAHRAGCRNGHLLKTRPVLAELWQARQEYEKCKTDTLVHKYRKYRGTLYSLRERKSGAPVQARRARLRAHFRWR